MKLEVGKKYRYKKGWDNIFTVIAIGAEHVLAQTEEGNEYVFSLPLDWTPVEETEKPKKPSERIMEELDRTLYGYNFIDTFAYIRDLKGIVSKILDELWEKGKI